MSKLAERIIHKHLTNILEENNLLYSHHFGFCKGMSTEQAVALFLDDIQSKVTKGRLVAERFIDLSKAFDVISHSKLPSKLPTYGMHSLELEWFADYLFNRRAIVKYEREQSEKFSLSKGVPQGSILGPFNIILLTRGRPNLPCVSVYGSAQGIWFSFSCEGIFSNFLNEETSLSSLALRLSLCLLQFLFSSTVTPKYFTTWAV